MKVKWKLLISCWVSVDIILLILWNERSWMLLLIGLNHLCNEWAIVTELLNWTYGIIYNRFELIGMSIKLKLNIIYWMCCVESSCVDMECFDCWSLSYNWLIFNQVELQELYLVVWYCWNLHIHLVLRVVTTLSQHLNTHRGKTVEYWHNQLHHPSLFGHTSTTKWGSWVT